MTVEEKALKQTIVIDVMPLVGGHLPLPAIRLSKYSFSLSLSCSKPLLTQLFLPRYIPADTKQGLGGARLDPFATGQVYNMSRLFRKLSWCTFVKDP